MKILSALAVIGLALAAVVTGTLAVAIGVNAWTDRALPKLKYKDFRRMYDMRPAIWECEAFQVRIFTTVCGRHFWDCFSFKIWDLIKYFFWNATREAREKRTDREVKAREQMERLENLYGVKKTDCERPSSAAESGTFPL